jgi:hypothetical protein
MPAQHHLVVPVSAREMTAEDRAAQARLVRRAANFGPVTGAPGETFPALDSGHLRADFVMTMSEGRTDGLALVERLVVDLELGRIRTVAFVVQGEVRWTLPLYRMAITTARRGWSIGLDAPRYWFVTPEPAPLVSLGAAASAAASARLDPEGITFVGSTFADVRPGVVLLDPQDARIEIDRVVTLADATRTWSSADCDGGTRTHAPPRLGSSRGASTDATRSPQARRWLA